MLVDLADAELRKAVTLAVRATGMALEATERPELVICDRAAAKGDSPIFADHGRPTLRVGARVPAKIGTVPGEAWRLEIVGGKEAAAYAGPFVVDRTHPLARGLSLDGAIWAASAQAELGGSAVVTAGNVTLLTDREDAAGRHRFQMNFSPALSNLPDLPDWPILFDNLLRWRRGAHLGAATPNVRLGQTVSIALAEDVKQVALAGPAAAARKLDVHHRRVEAPADRVGLYALTTPTAVYRFAVNALGADESDLRAACTGRWGDWSGSAIHRDRQIGLRWVFLLLAMAVLAPHAIVVATRRN